MQTVYEMIKSTNHIFDIYKLGEDEPELIIVDRAQIEQVAKDKTKEVCYLVHPHLNACDALDEPCPTEHENIRLFLEKFKEPKDFRYITGFYNFEVIAIDINCEEASILEVLEHLSKHPTINA